MKRIPLTKGQYALVDNEDFDWLNQWRWFALEDRSGNFYPARMASRKKRERFVIRMSREILGLKRGDKRQADHKDHKSLNNRRDNLRICTHQENQMNQKPQRRITSSKYKGVCWCKRHKKWQVQIMINKTVKHLGYFISEKEAALVYNNGAKKYFGDFAYLNVIV